MSFSTAEETSQIAKNGVGLLTTSVQMSNSMLAACLRYLGEY